MEQQGKPTLVIRQGNQKVCRNLFVKEKIKEKDKKSFYDNNTSYYYQKDNLEGAPPPKLIKRLPPEQLNKRKAEKRKERLKNNHRNAAYRPPIEVPKHLKPYVDLWRKYGGQKHENETTKTFGRGVSALRELVEGTMFIGASLPDDKAHWRRYHRFTVDEFETSLKNFHLALTSKDHFPSNKKNLMHMTLENFIYQTFTKQNYSPLLFYLEKPPRQRFPDNNPTLTKLLISYYQDNILGGITYNPTMLERNKFVKASNRLQSFFDEHRDKISPGFPIDKPRMVRWLFEAIQQSLNGFENPVFEPGHLCSELTFEKRLPRFMTSQAIFKDRHTVI